MENAELLFILTCCISTILRTRTLIFFYHSCLLSQCILRSKKVGNTETKPQFFVSTASLVYTAFKKKKVGATNLALSQRRAAATLGANFARVTPVTRSVSRTLRKHRFSACMSYWYLFHLTGFFFPCPRHIRHSRLPREAHIWCDQGPIQPRSGPKDH